MSNPTRAFVEHIARRAGSTLLSHFGTDAHLREMRTTVKEAVTDYDKMVDELIIRCIR